MRLLVVIRLGFIYRYYIVLNDAGHRCIRESMRF